MIWIYLANNGVKPTDLLTTISTLVLAVAAIVTIIVTRSNATADREAADSRLREAQNEANANMEAERKSADERLATAYSRAEEQRLRDRQLMLVPKLLTRIERFRKLVPSMLLQQYRGAFPVLSNPEIGDVVHGLREGAGTDAIILGDPPVRARFETLAQLAEDANNLDPNAMTAETRDRIVEDLRRYALFVRLSLQGLIDETPVHDLNPPARPDLRSTNPSLAPWDPVPAPDGWKEVIRS